MGLLCDYGIVALLDTGAEVSLLSDRVYKHLQRVQRQIIPLEVTRTGLITANSGRIEVLGRCGLQIPGIPYYEFLVVKDLACHVVLGTDFYYDFEVATDYKRKKVRIGGKWQDATTMSELSRKINTVPRVSEYSALLERYPEVMDPTAQLGTAKGIEMRIERGSDRRSRCSADRSTC